MGKTVRNLALFGGGSNSRDKVGDAAKEAYSKLLGVLDRLKKRGQAEASV